MVKNPPVKSDYLMESDEEALRLDVKTDNRVTERQALWAGLRPGMRVADVGCGSGKTTAKLLELASPGGSAVGIDIAEQRVLFARRNYGGAGVEFLRRDARQPLEELGRFDFVWVRFVLEYYRSGSLDIVRNLARLVEPGGILCLIDLDYNCLSHYGLSDRMERAIRGIMRGLEAKGNFDPFVGRKLYSFLYDLGFEDITVDVSAHHVIYGELRESDAFNWLKKVEVAPKRIGYEFTEYAGGYEEFLQEFQAFFADPRRFTYTPVIACRGRRPLP